jgi:glutathione peroxidase-family protein
MKPVQDKLDDAYLNGEKNAYNNILRECIKYIGYDSDTSRLLEMEIKLSQVKDKLIEICEVLGDDVDLKKLDVFDIADKHILPIVESLQTQQKIKTSSSTQRNLFNFWKFMLNHPQARESEKYLKPISQRLKEGHTFAQLSHAICGLSLSKYHIDNGYTHIYYALRDDKQVLMMINVADKNGVTEEKAETQYEWFVERFNSGHDIKELIKLKDTKISKRSVNPKTGEELL